MAMDSDGERDDDEETQNNLFLSTQQETYTCTACPGDEIDGPRIRFPCPRARVTSMVIRKLEILFYSCLTVNKSNVKTKTNSASGQCIYTNF